MAYSFSVLIFFLGCAFAVLSIVLWSMKNGISPMPTTNKTKEALYSLLPYLDEGIVYELGSGWGSLLISLAKFYPNCSVVGYETSPIPYYVSTFIVWAIRLNNIDLHKKDFFAIPLSEASIVVCYLYPGAMSKLKLKFEKELRPGTLIISNTFAIPGWTPAAIAESKDLYRTKVYLYKK
jgi:hypothetical protein